MDGTLIDSNEAHTRAWLDVLKPLGFEPSFDEVRKLIGMGGDKVLPMLTKIDAESSNGKKISEMRGEIFREKYLPELRTFPKVRELFLFLKQKSIEFSIATSASEEDSKALLKKCGIDDLIKKKTNSDDASNSKPDPDIIKVAAKTMNAPKGDLVMIGDTPYDLEAAKRAGINSFAFRCGGYWGDQDFSVASYIFDSPADLLETLKNL